MSSKQLKLLVIDNDSFFTTHIEYYCTINDWECLIEDSVPDKNFKLDCDYILLEDSLVKEAFSKCSHTSYEKICRQLKGNTSNASIILYSQHKIKQETLLPLLSGDYGKPPLLYEVSGKPYDLNKLNQIHQQHVDKPIKRPKQQALDANLKLPVAIAIFDITNIQVEQPLWSNYEWDKRQLSAYDERLLRLTLHELEQDFLAKKQNLAREFRFPSTKGGEIVDWNFWLVDESVYFSRRFQALNAVNDNFNYLDAQRDPVKRFKKVRDLLAQRYGISRIRVYETDRLQDSFHEQNDINQNQEILMIPRFISGGGTVDKAGNYSTAAWFSDEFRKSTSVNSGMQKKINDNLHLESIDNAYCHSVHWGKAGTKAQINVKDTQQVKWGHIVLDQRLDHMRRDKSNGKLRKELAMVLRANPFVSPEGKVKIGIPPLSEEEVSALQPFLSMLNPAVSRWLKARREKSLQHWHLASSLILRNVLGKNLQQPAEAYHLIFQAMTAVWPLMQGLRLPSKAYLEQIIPEESNKQQWDTMLSQLYQAALQPERNVAVPASPEPIPLDDFIAYHAGTKGLTNLYIAQQFENNCFQVLGGYGSLGTDIRRIGQPWEMMNPHQKAFQRAAESPPKPTIILDYRQWAKEFQQHPFDEKEQNWREELKRIGSWCALPVFVSRKTGYPALLIATSNYPDYFSHSRVELLQRLANRMLPIVLWNEEWQYARKVNHVVMHDMSGHLNSLKNEVDQQNWKNVHALVPLLSGVYNNLKFTSAEKKAGIAASENSYSTHFGDVLRHLSVLKSHENYSTVLQDWDQWQQYETLNLNIPKSPLQQILYNLLANAAQYAIPGTVCMDGLLKTHHLELFIGNKCQSELTEHDRRYLFIEGYRGKHKNNSGTGLGLGVAKKLAKESGAKLELCDSDNWFSAKHFSDVAVQLRFCISLTLPLST